MIGNETRRKMKLGLWNKKGFSQRMNWSTVVAPSDLWPWPHLVMSHLISGSLVHNCVWENLNECHLGDSDYDLVCQGNERQAHRSLPWMWDGVSAEALCTTDGPRHGSPTWLWDYKPYHNNITSYFAIKHGITRTILHTACHVFKDSKSFPWAFHQNSSKEMHLSYLSYPQSHIPQHKGINTLWRVEKWAMLVTSFLRLKDAQRATRALDLS